MRTIIVKENQAGKRIDKLIRESFPHMPVSALHKAFRKRDIKVNGVRVKDNFIVEPGDELGIYIVDEILDGKPLKSDGRLTKGFSIVYEDSNILIVNKEQGIPVHPDREQSSGTLIDNVQEYLKETGGYNPNNPDSFVPSLCHRLDRNTGGLVIIAKNSRSLEILLDKIKDKEIKKFYQCLVSGKMDKNYEELSAYLVKDENKSRVFISEAPSRDSLKIVTRYRVLSSGNDISKLEVELVTGRTHQIRAHLAYIGHPIVGDGKYGSNAFNRAIKAKYQALWAYKLIFNFKDAEMLNYLRGRTFEVEPEFKFKSNRTAIKREDRG